MTTPTLVLIVPCYNEAARLKEGAFLTFAARHAEVSFLFVDDGSRDGTFDLLRRLERAAPDRMSSMRLDRNQGKAEAVRRGILAALDRHPALVGFWDADLSTPLDAVRDFLAVAASREEMDLILGSRVLLMGRDIRRKAWRHYLGRVFATAASVALGLPVYDTQCGAKVFRANAAIAHLFQAPFRSAWIFDVEVISRYLDEPVLDGGLPRWSRIYELSVPAWHEVPGSKLRPSDFLRSMFELVGVWRGRRAARRGSRG